MGQMWLNVLLFIWIWQLLLLLLLLLLLYSLTAILVLFFSLSFYPFAYCSIQVQMGLNLHDAVTLMGAHTMGHVHVNTAGVGRPGQAEEKSPEAPILFNAWDDSPTVFDNGYFVFLLGADWKNTRTVAKSAMKNTWLDADPTAIMLTSDVSLVFRPTLK
jgi:hypothetical protein